MDGLNLAGALCAQPDKNPDDWFPTSQTPAGEIERVVSICQACPVREACRKLDIEYGIVGGELRRLSDE